jgi:hypothetical protein
MRRFSRDHPSGVELSCKGEDIFVGSLFSFPTFSSKDWSNVGIERGQAGQTNDDDDGMDTIR